MTADLEREIEETRERLAETIDALAAKLDVKTRAKESLASADTRRIGTAAAVAVIGVVV
ncbi:MAG: hypothetical protein JWP31_255, partial [Aeromicrobium sp.]|nr:hypothetical protein [Aeromicrobium sp.]